MKTEKSDSQIPVSCWSQHLRRRVQFDQTGEESLTIQSAKDECDIYNILKRHNADPSAYQHLAQGVYGDFSEVPDYQSSFQIVIDAQNTFDALPSKIRDRFGNDPANFIEFVGNGDNRDEAIKLGLIEVKAEVPEVVQKVVITNPEALKA